MFGAAFEIGVDAGEFGAETLELLIAVQIVDERFVILVDENHDLAPRRDVRRFDDPFEPLGEASPPGLLRVNAVTALPLLEKRVEHLGERLGLGVAVGVEVEMKHRVFLPVPVH